MDEIRVVTISLSWRDDIVAEHLNQAIGTDQLVSFSTAISNGQVLFFLHLRSKKGTAR